VLRQYYAQRCRGGDNPLRVGVIAVGSIYYLQEQAFFHDRYGGRAVCRSPWIVEAILNGTIAAARRNRDTGQWEDVYTIGRSDMALVRSLRDRSRVQKVAVRTLIVHDDLCLWKEPTQYPTLPDTLRHKPARMAAPASRATQRIRPARDRAA
jgi:hypothetical protein